MAQYEVWCPACDVSFPPGTKRCLHCGGRTQNERPAADRGASKVFDFGSNGIGSNGIGSGAEHAAQEGFMEFSGGQPLEAEQESPRRRGLRAGMSIVWMVLLAAGYLWQNCVGGG